MGLIVTVNYCQRASVYRGRTPKKMDRVSGVHIVRTTGSKKGLERDSLPSPVHSFFVHPVRRSLHLICIGGRRKASDRGDLVHVGGKTNLKE